LTDAATVTIRVGVRHDGKDDRESKHDHGDRCDHERDRNGHFGGDECEHDRRMGRRD
jgi:hypothetical protein